MMWLVAVAVALGIAAAIYDLTQRQHTIFRTFPIIGHFRYLLTIADVFGYSRGFGLPSPTDCEEARRLMNA